MDRCDEADTVLRVAEQPTRAVEEAMEAVHAALVVGFPDATLARVPIYHHWEDEELGFAPLYEVLQIRVAPAGFPAWCTSSREGDAIEGMFSAWYDARAPGGPYALVFDADDRAELWERGWKGPSTWRARWSPDDAARVVAAFTVLANVLPCVLVPEDLPRDCPWPGSDLLFHVLLADVEGSEGVGERRILRTRVDGEAHRVAVAEGSPEDALWRWWLAHPPAMRRVSRWPPG